MDSSTCSRCSGPAPTLAPTKCQQRQAHFTVFVPAVGHPCGRSSMQIYPSKFTFVYSWMEGELSQQGIINSFVSFFLFAKGTNYFLLESVV